MRVSALLGLACVFAVGACAQGKSPTFDPSGDWRLVSAGDGEAGTSYTATGDDFAWKLAFGSDGVVLSTFGESIAQGVRMVRPEFPRVFQARWRVSSSADRVIVNLPESLSAGDAHRKREWVFRVVGENRMEISIFTIVQGSLPAAGGSDWDAKRFVLTRKE